MTHSYDDPQGVTPRDKTERWLIRGFSVILAVAAVVSLVHLVGQYRQAGPYRETLTAESIRAAAKRQAEDAVRRAEREAEAAMAQARGQLGSTTDALPPPVAVPSGDLSREEIKRSPTVRGAAITAPHRGSVSTPTRWYIPPSWPSVRSDAFPPGVSQVAVQFRCRVSRDGALSNCTATEQPAGAGLADRLRPALDRARMEPMTVEGRPVESTASFGVSFSSRPLPVAAPPASSADTGTPPAVQGPPPEPAPVG